MLYFVPHFCESQVVGCLCRKCICFGRVWLVVFCVRRLYISLGEKLAFSLNKTSYSIFAK